MRSFVESIKSFNKTSHLFSLLLYLILLVCPTYSEAADLYAIFVGDTVSDDIKLSVQADIKMMKGEANKIAMYTGLKVKEVVLEGRQATTGNLLNKVKSIALNPDDVVIFYFSGHGFRTPSKQGNPWPNLFFTGEQKAVDFLAVTNVLKEKHPRLILAIADCCNNSIVDWFAPQIVNVAARNQNVDPRIQANYRKLFLDTQGVIIASGSKAGEVAWCAENGALYTMAISKSLFKEVREPAGEASWTTLLDRASFDVDQYQHPQYQLMAIN